MRWKPALNAFAVTFGDRFPAAETYYPNRRKHRSCPGGSARVLPGQTSSLTVTDSPAPPGWRGTARGTSTLIARHSGTGWRVPWLPGRSPAAPGRQALSHAQFAPLRGGEIRAEQEQPTAGALDASRARRASGRGAAAVARGLRVGWQHVTGADGEAGVAAQARHVDGPVPVDLTVWGQRVVHPLGRRDEPAVWAADVRLGGRAHCPVSARAIAAAYPASSSPNLPGLPPNLAVHRPCWPSAHSR
jgi:hypothetical protein